MSISEQLLACTSLPVRGAWVEIQIDDLHRKGYTSLPVRGAWVEISAFIAIFRV